MRRGEWAVLVGVTALTLAAAVADRPSFVRGPAPYPPEWQWGYDPKPTLPRAWLPIACAAALVGMQRLVEGAASHRGRRGALLALAVAVGWGYQAALLALERDGALAEMVRRTASGSFTSYHKVAAFGAGRDAADFLRRHHELLPALRRGTLHAATHPPGPVLFFRAAIVAAEAVPVLGEMASRLMSATPLDPRALSPPLGPAPLAAALVAGALLGLLGAAACIPVARLGTTLTGDPAAGLRLALLWPLVPGLSLFVPEIDQALCLPVAAAAASFAAAVATGDPRRRSVAAALAGAWAGIAAFLSYGAPLLVVVAGVAVVAGAWSAGASPRQLLSACALAAAAGFVIFLAPMAVGHHPLASLSVAIGIHREAFTARRDYALWLLFNPWDMALFLGPALALLGARTLVLALRKRAEERDGVERFAIALAAALAVLLVSGVVRGEAGRILLPLMPALLVAAAGSVAGRAATASGVGILLAVTAVVLRLAWRLP